MYISLSKINVISGHRSRITQIVKLCWNFPVLVRPAA